MANPIDIQSVQKGGVFRSKMSAAHWLALAIERKARPEVIQAWREAAASGDWDNRHYFPEGGA